MEVEGSHQAEASRDCKIMLTRASLGGVQWLKSPPCNGADAGWGRAPTFCRATEARRPQPLSPNSRAHKPQPLSPGANREMEQLWQMQNDL